MSSKARRGGADRGKESGEDGVVVDRKMIETIREATGATEDDIRVMLFECNYDANETTSRLIDNPFSQVQSKKDKKKKREEDRKKEPATKVVEVRRSASQGGRSRGHERERSQRGERSDKLPDRGAKAGQPTAPIQSIPVPEKQSAVSTESSAPGGWDHIAAGGAETEQPSTSSLGGEATSASHYASAWQPIGPPSQPTPIQPPSGGAGGKRSMADLFKKPQDPALPLRPAHAAAPAPSSSQPKPQPEGSEPNGWGLPHVADAEPTRQSDSLGGVAVNAPQKPAPSAPVQISMSPRIPPQQPVGSSSHVSASPGGHSQLDEQVSAPSTTGLGGVPVEAPPRQYADSQTQSAWAPKVSAAPGPGSQPTLGSSILSTLGASAAASASGTLSRGEEPLAPTSQILHQPDLSRGSSAFGSSHSPVILPPSNQQGSSDIGGLSFQFGNFGLGAGPELGGSFNSSSLNSGFEPPAGSQLPDSQAPSGSQTSEPFRIGSFSQPQSSLAPSTILPQAAPVPPQQQQHQRAYNAFNSAVQPQAPQRPAASASADATGPPSQGLYGSQAYSNYVGSQGYSQHQAPSAPQQPSQSYGFQTAADSDHNPTSSTLGSHQQPAVAPHKRPAGYETPSYTSYAQGAGPKDFPIAKYGSAGQPSHGHHLGAAGGAPSSVQPAAALASQNPLSQITGYAAGVGGMGPQGYSYGAQQPYNNYPQQQYNSFGGHPGNSYSYSGGGQAGYQAGGYGVGSGNYSQGGKYGRNYGGAGGVYQQHAGGYGGQPHKQEKEHQAPHLSGHDLYGQQLLGGQQHYPAAGLRDSSGYGYQNPAPGYGGYSRQYNQPYYGRDQ